MKEPKTIGRMRHVKKGFVNKAIAIVESMIMQMTQIARMIFCIRSLRESVLHLVLNHRIKTKYERHVKSRKAMKTGDSVGFLEYGTPILSQSNTTCPRSNPSLSFNLLRHHIGVSMKGIMVIYTSKKNIFIGERYF